MFLQLNLLIDFERASRLLDRLEKEGVVSPPSGASPRQVLINKQ